MTYENSESALVLIRAALAAGGPFETEKVWGDEDEAFALTQGKGERRPSAWSVRRKYRWDAADVDHAPLGVERRLWETAAELKCHPHLGGAHRAMARRAYVTGETLPEGPFVWDEDGLALERAALHRAGAPSYDPGPARMEILRLAGVEAKTATGERLAALQAKLKAAERNGYYAE
jgi:hypothetical protein